MEVQNMAKRKFTAEFKAALVLEALREERQVGEIASEHGISPNLLRNWKKEFEDNAARVFNESERERKADAKVKSLEAKQEALYNAVGQVTFERDWLKKKAAEIFGEGYEAMLRDMPD
jgi:transposase-like protein